MGDTTAIMYLLLDWSSENQLSYMVGVGYLIACAYTSLVSRLEAGLSGTYTANTHLGEHSVVCVPLGHATSSV